MGASRVSDYQPRPQGGWPAQPPPNSGGQDRDGYGQQGSYNQQGGYSQQGGYGQPGGYGSRGRAARPRRRRRGWVVLTVIVVVILAILAIGDQVAKGIAQNQIAQKIQTSGLNTKPSVGIEGWPFLTQLAAKDIKAIDINASNVKTGQFEITSIKARATGVHLSSLSANASATIDHIDGTATISYQSLANDLGNAINLPGISSVGSIAPDPANGPDAVKVDFSGLASVDATVKQTSTEPDHHPLRQARRHRLAARRRWLDPRPGHHDPEAARRARRQVRRGGTPGHRRHRLGNQHDPEPVAAAPRCAPDYGTGDTICHRKRCDHRQQCHIATNRTKGKNRKRTRFSLSLAHNERERAVHILFRSRP